MNDTVNLRAPETQSGAFRIDPLIGVEVDGYVLRRTISHGGMGVVYEAHDPRGDRKAALKVMRPEYRGDEALTARFHGEIKWISAIRHPNVVEVLSTGVLPEAGAYMMMEFIEGPTLSELIERSAPLDEAVVLQICEDVLLALTAIHDTGAVHRDLKPANILLRQRAGDAWVAQVCDFGLARGPENRSLTASGASLKTQEEALGSVAGTPEYMSPEQACGQPVDGQADLYSLGVMLFEMLSGWLPFRAASGVEMLRMQCSDPPPRIRSLETSVAPELEEFVAQLLAKAPADRPHGPALTVDLVRALRRNLALPSCPRVPRVRPSLREEGFSEAITTELTRPGTGPGLKAG